MHKSRGHPLWLPSPDSTCLLPSQREKGLSIGDVGILTISGAFDFLFNVYLPADDPIHLNCDRLPEGFSAFNLPLTQTDIRELQTFPEGSSLDSTYVGPVWSCQEPDESVFLSSTKFLRNLTC